MKFTIHVEDTDDMPMTDKAVQALDRLTAAVDGLAARVTTLEGKSAGATDAELDAFADSLNAVADKVDAIDPAAATTSDTTGQIPAVPSGEAAPPQTF
jgi:hypothetical protein